MSNNAIIVIAKDLPDWWTDIAHPRMVLYAQKCAARLVVITPDKWEGQLTRQITAEHVAQYDRSLVLDADVVISREAPSIFDVHGHGFAWAAQDCAPEDPKAYRQFHIITMLQAIMGPLKWTEGYANTGVVLCDREHANLWRNWTPLPPGTCPDQANLNYKIRQTHHGFAPMARAWNAFGLNSPDAPGTEIPFVMTNEGRVPMDLMEPYNALWRIPAICSGAYIAHAAGFSGPERCEAIQKMNKLLP